MADYVNVKLSRFALVSWQLNHLWLNCCPMHIPAISPGSGMPGHLVQAETSQNPLTYQRFMDTVKTLQFGYESIPGDILTTAKVRGNQKSCQRGNSDG